MSSFGNLDDFEGSFSFSTTAGSNFNSEDEDADDNEYIEIALDHHHHHHNQSKHQQQEEDDLDYFRISFSSSAAPPFPELIISESDRTTQALPNPKTNQHITFSDDSVIYTPTPSSSSSSYSSSSSSLSACPSSSGFYNTRRRRILDSLLLSFRVPPPESFSAKGSGGGDEDQKQSQLTIHHADNGDPLHNSNTKKLASSKFKTAATMNNSSGIKKLFIKLRGIKMASIVKPRRVGVAAVVPPQGTPDNTNNNNGYSIYNKKTSCETVDYYGRLIKPLDKRLFGRNKDRMISSSIKSSRDQVGEKSNRVLEMNMGAVRGVLEAMSIAINGRKDRKTGSCPSSIVSSPLHEGVPSDQYCYYKSYSRENSIQSAIAHCKTSFARSTLSDDFRF